MNIISQLDGKVKFPLLDGDKKPACLWRNGVTLPEVLEGQNYAVHTGRSGLTVIDLDRHGAADGIETFRSLCPNREIPDTFTVSTPNKGMHLYFKGDNGRNTGVWAGVDVLGGEGYVVGPGSHLENFPNKDGSFVTGDYTIVNDVPIANYPVWLRDKVRERQHSVKVMPIQGSVSNADRLEWGSRGINPYRSLDALCDDMAVTEQGTRNNNLNKFAYSAFMNPDINDDEAGVRLFEAAKQAGSPDDKKIADTIKSAYKAARRDRDMPDTTGKTVRIDTATGEVLPEPASFKLSLKPLSDIAFRKVKWAWDTTADGDYEGTGGRFPVGTISIGAGRPGAGKGQFAAWLGAQISNGTLPGCFEGKPKGVIIYSTEDSNSMTIGPRFKAAGADLEKVYIFKREADTVGEMAMVRVKQDLDDLHELIVSHDIGLIIFDPLISVLDGKTDVNQETAVRSELEPFQAMLETVDCFAFGIMHFRKMKDEDILNMFSGSGAFPRIVRSAIAFGSEKDEDGEQTRVISTVKNNLGRTDLPSYKYDFETCKIHTDDGISHVSKLVMKGEAVWSVEELNEGKHNGEKARSGVDKASLWLDKHLQRGPVLKDDIKIAYDEEFNEDNKDFSWRSVERASSKMSVIVSKGYGGKGTWAAKF